MPKVVSTDAKGLIQETGSGFEVRGSQDGTVPAFIALEGANGNLYYISIDNAGKVRVSAANTAPTAHDSGTVVGTQS
tara:strand:- start:184 stop:414 length:231 start_codon:yes stop_codon:yes gene_type:complete